VTATGSEAVQVQTVLGPIGLADLGVTMMHEHTVSDLSEAGHTGVRPFSVALSSQKVSAANAWMLREDPYSNPDNCCLDDEDITVAELGLLVEAGGQTLVDNSTGRGRHPDALVRLAQRTGLNVVMASGWSLAHGSDDSWGDADPQAFADQLVAEHRDGVCLADGQRIFPGVIGEIGVGPNFTRSEWMTLHAAALAQPRTGVPLLIHLPGWQRRAHEVLDIVFGHGIDPGSVVLAHMDPSGKDTVYQREIASRGVWLEFDMIGMPNNFPGEGQSPSVQDTVDAVSGLIADGLFDQLLLSQDMFLKNMWTRYGGNGYGFVLSAFLPRLFEAGVPEELTRALMTSNPAQVFANAARSGRPTA